MCLIFSYNMYFALINIYIIMLHSRAEKHVGPHAFYHHLILFKNGMQ
jgi:hypothetical protein